ncbi:MAG: hypothetical protein IJ539_02960 [Prevotella sp.]|nr:hypothetical protein [Prevotella sp.]
MTTPIQFPVTNLADIRTRKESLRQDIKNDEERVTQLWQRLTTPEQPAGLMTPSRRVAGLMSTGMNVIDGLLLGWKLYRKFGKKGRLRL